MKRPTLPKTWKNVLAYSLVCVGLLVSHYVTTSHSNDIDAHTRSGVCLLLTQVDVATYKQFHEHKLSASKLQLSLDATAFFRGKEGPAPGCSPKPSPPSTPSPFRPGEKA